MSKRERARLGAAALLAATSACHSEDDSGDAAPRYWSLPVIAGCERQSFAACDSLDRVCQQRVFATMQCLRQMPEALMPPVRVLSSAEQLAEIQAQLAQQEPEETAQNQIMERALRMLSLAEPGELAPENVAQVFVDTSSAYYDPQTGVVTLTRAESGSPRDLEEETLTLAHEFTHALQDQDVGIDSVYEGTDGFDDYLARDSLIEGEATMQESFVAAAIWGFTESPDFREHFTSWLSRVEEDLQQASPVLIAPRYLPYTYGSRYVYNLYEDGGVPEVRARFADPPRSVLPILLSLDRLDEPALESLAELTEPGPLAGFEQVSSDRLGPWVLQTFLQRLLPDAPPAELVQAWRGDRLSVYASEGTAQSVSAFWTLRFADAEAAQSFEGLLAAGGERYPLRASSFRSRRDRDVTIGVSEDLTALPDWSAALEFAQQTWAESAPPAAPTPPPAASPPRRSAPAILARRWLP